MIRRDKRNIGKRVWVANPDSWLNHRTGIVKGFRGDVGRSRPGVPYVSVLIDDLGSIEPIPGDRLNRCK